MKTIDVDLHDEIEKKISSLDLPNLEKVRHVCNKIFKADKNGEIGSINRIFFKSIRKNLKTSPKIDTEMLRIMDEANIYTWIAYSIYDEIIDEQIIDILSDANILLREAISAYIRAGVSIDFIYEQFSVVDRANAKELHLRDKRPLNPNSFRPLLSRKSIAHCLGQLWIAKLIGSPSFNIIESSLYEYCSARQLSDDIYDWRDDIKKGQHTYATAFLLNLCSLNGTKSISPRDFEELNIKFWESGLESLCEDVIGQAQSSSKGLDCILSNKSDYVELFINPLLISAQHSIASHIKLKAKYY